jgi:YfiH family protein
MAQLYQTPDIFIFFGDAGHSFVPQQYYGSALLERQPFKGIPGATHLEQLVFLRQVHGAEGKFVVSNNIDQLPSFVDEGDFLITNVPRFGLGTATADCLPVVMIDLHAKAVGVAHAGWRGSVAGIAQAMFERMTELFGTGKDDIQVFFGPSAKSCCYQVQEDFLEHLAPFDYAGQSIMIRNKKIYFDSTAFNHLQLQRAGIPLAAISTEYNWCTMCNNGFCSARRMQNKQRQMTVVALK